MKYLSIICCLFFLSHSLVATAQITLDRNGCAGYDQGPASNQRLLPLTTDHQGHLELDVLQSNQVDCLALENNLPALLSGQSVASDPLRSVARDQWDEEWVPDLLADYYYNSDGLFSNTFTSMWDTTANAYSLINKTIREYGPDGLVSTNTSLVYDHEQHVFVNSFRSEFDWYSPQQILSNRSFSWDSTEWRPRFTTDYTIENGLITSILSTDYNQDLNRLTNSFLTSYEHDDMDRVRVRLGEIWDLPTETWRPLSLDSTTYGDLYSINARYFFDPQDSTWNQLSKVTTTFNEQMQVLVRADTVLFTDPPRPSSIRTNSYNEMGLLSEVIHQFFDITVNELVDFWRTLYAYDEDGDRTEIINQVSEAGAWVNDARTSYTYAPALVSNEVERERLDAALNVYPSPARGLVNVELTLGEPSELQVDVYDLLGRRIATLVNTSSVVGTQQFAWDAQHMPAGLYFLRVRLNGAVQTRSVVLAN